MCVSPTVNSLAALDPDNNADSPRHLLFLTVWMQVGSWQTSRPVVFKNPNPSSTLFTECGYSSGGFESIPIAREPPANGKKRAIKPECIHLGSAHADKMTHRFVWYIQPNQLNIPTPRNVQSEKLVEVHRLLGGVIRLIKTRTANLNGSGLC